MFFVEQRYLSKGSCGVPRIDFGKVRFRKEQKAGFVGTLEMGLWSSKRWLWTEVKKVKLRHGRKTELMGRQQSQDQVLCLTALSGMNGCWHTQPVTHTVWLAAFLHPGKWDLGFTSKTCLESKGRWFFIHRSSLNYFQSNFFLVAKLTRIVF